MITIDGAQGEGGGQIVRTALALSALTGKAIEVHSIRAGRKVPGLKAQHVHAARALEKLCSAELEGAEERSERLRFIPGAIDAKRVQINVGTAGSLTLVLQAVLLPACFANRALEIELHGGTDTLWSPPYNFFTELLLPHFEPFASLSAKLIRRGFYPRGGGEVTLNVKPRVPYQAVRSEAQPYALTELKPLLEVHGLSFASRDLKKRSVAERQATGSRHALAQLGVPVRIQREYVDTLSTGSGVVLWGCYEGGKVGADALGEMHKPAEAVGAEAAQRLLEELNGSAPVDQLTADSIIPLLALRGGKIKVTSVTNHTLTNIAVVNQLLDSNVRVEDNVICAD